MNNEPTVNAIRESCVGINRVTTDIFAMLGVSPCEILITGKTANDGTGDSICLALSKIHENLYNLKIRLTAADIK